MADRTALADAFLARGPFSGARRADLAGDASSRRYERLTRAGDGATAVLMDAPADAGNSLGSFTTIAKHLRGLGLSAPKILDSDPDHGFLLLEDLGDALFARVLDQDPGLEHRLYGAAVDVLVHLQRRGVPPGIPVYGPTELARAAEFVYRWYRNGGTAGSAACLAFSRELETVLARWAPETNVLALRDYHAENLIWLPRRDGVARAGLLDFQDTVAAHPAYDLVSLLKDARRDVGAGTEAAMIDRFVTQTDAAADEFGAAYACIGVQRNLRIIGIFARLSLHSGKTGYVDLIPRVWDHAIACLSHPALEPLSARVLSDLPPPTPDRLQSLKDRCNTVPTP